MRRLNEKGGEERRGEALQKCRLPLSLPLSLAHVQFDVVPRTPLAEGLNLELQSFSGAQVMLLNCPDPQQLH